MCEKVAALRVLAGFGLFLVATAVAFLLDRCLGLGRPAPSVPVAGRSGWSQAMVRMP